jgi:hypothetical protein
MIDFQTAALIVAHPDDEIIWFSSILGRVKRVFICFMEIQTASARFANEGRLKVMEHYPLDHVEFLKLREADVYLKGDWKRPQLGDYGMALATRCPEYESNFSMLCELLAPRIGAFKHIFTSSPWGEYGHEEHVQLNRVIRHLKKICNFDYDVWFPACGGARSEKLRREAIKSSGSQRVSYPTDAVLIKMITGLYQYFHCWTWDYSFKFPARDTFMKDEGEA